MTGCRPWLPGGYKKVVARASCQEGLGRLGGSLFGAGGRPFLRAAREPSVELLPSLAKAKPFGIEKKMLRYFRILIAQKIPMLMLLKC